MPLQNVVASMELLPRWLITIPILVNLSFVIATINYLFYKIIKSDRKINEHQQCISCTAIMFMTVNWLTAIFHFALCTYNLGIYLVRGTIVKRFSPNQANLLWDLIAGFLFLCQNYMLLIALFTRIRVLFASSPLPLSKCTILFYISALTLLPFLIASPFLVVSFTHGVGEIVSRILVGSTCFLFVAFLVSLLAMFTAKLKQIQRNKTLNAFIHRQVILAILTVIVLSLILGIVALAPFLRDKGPDDENYEGYSTVGYLWISATDVLFVPFHILCNFLCIALSYRCCDSMFVICCGCLRCCRVIPITTEDQNAIFLEQIMQNADDKARDAKANHIEHQQPVVRVQPVDLGTGASVPAAPAVIAMTVLAPNPAVGAPAAPRAPAAPFQIVYEY